MATATKKRAVVGAHVEIEPGRYSVEVYKWDVRDGETREDAYARKLEDWAKEVQEFFRDHRHQDVNSVSVVREYEDQCSECRSAWETYLNEDSGNTECASCGAFVEGPNPPVSEASK